MKRAQELEQAVEKLLRLMNVHFIRVDNYRCFKCGQVQNSNAKGWPDFFCFYPFLLAIECKTGAGRLTAEQKSTLRNLTKVGVDTIVLRDNVDALIDFLKEKTGK